MTRIPLEDSFADVIGKAQRGSKISDDDLCRRAAIAQEQLAKLKAGEWDEAAARKLAPPLNLAANALVELGKKSWFPAGHQLNGLASFNTTFEDMTVNAYLVFDP
ncbi:MAG: MBL fold metallo-hydrolase, partial [Verrucomicrobiota bacterium]